jgi:hypothetical protein
MKNFTLFYQSETADCTGEYSGDYSSIDVALRELTAKVLLEEPDAEILAIGQSETVLMEIA